MKSKYLASEFLREGYLVIFDTKTLVGEGGNRGTTGKVVKQLPLSKSV